MTVIKPTVGRIVWYRAAEYDGANPLAAIVTYVHDDRTINLVAWLPNGEPLPRQGVPLIQEGDPRPGETHMSFAEWMPYQVGQAKKYEEQAAMMEKGYRAIPDPDKKGL